MTPVSNPDNVTQELPLSLATTDGPVRLLVSVPPTTSTLQATAHSQTQVIAPSRLPLSRTYYSNTGVRVSRTDDTDLDGTQYRDKPRAHTHTCLALLGTWGTQLKRYSGIGAGPPHSTSTNYDI
ncbi:hypothetical protein Taro_017356 [Colocasia esculenta]|uniref:Uncharacterized protein n=1 Tax=Colocasia esculenta TaxID=4460 RepID=A0A843UR00_COLES|nr:hypothetical protein [Colocasia esculenta]